MKLSYYFLNNNFLVFPSALLGIYFLLFFCSYNVPGITLVVLLLITFSTGYFIFQKYFEPMLYIIFLNFFNKNKTLTSIKKNNYVLITYFLIYYFFQIIYIFWAYN